MAPTRASVLPSRSSIARRAKSMPMKELTARIAEASAALEAHRAELDDELLALAAGMAVATQDENEASLRGKLHEFRGLAGTSGPEGARGVANVFKDYLDACRDRGVPPRWEVAATHVDALIVMHRARASSDAAKDHIAGLVEAARRALT